MERSAENRDFFVSYAQADRAWAEWLAWELEATGYTTLLQAWDMPAGTAFVHAMDQAVQHTRHILLVLSPAYLRSDMTEAEWRPGLVADPSGTQRRLLPVRVEECKPTGLLADRVWIDLVGLDEASARDRLREEVAGALRGHARPTNRPIFPAAIIPTASIERPRFPTALPPLWNVPYRRNAEFTGRHAELARFAAALSQAEITATQVLQGGAGVGKTALAVEYAYWHRSAFDTVWWVRAEAPTTLVGDYAELATALGLPEAQQADQEQAARAVRSWLDAHDRWLLILDNAEGPDTLTGLRAPLGRLVDLIPQVLHGQVLVASRAASWEREHVVLAELEVFTPQEAVAFLLARTGSNDQGTAVKVCELLGFLPLALEQAGAYVRETRLSLAGYLDRLQRYPALTMTRGRPRDRDPEDTVATTWQLSLDRVRPTPGAQALLEVCAFLGPEEIPRELFEQQLDPPAADLHVLAEGPFALDDAVAALRRLGLVKADEQVLTVHRLLQQIIREALDPASRTARVEAAVRLLNQALGPEADAGLDPRRWPTYARLLPHAMKATQYADQLEVEPLATASLFEIAANYLESRGRYGDARPLHERALAIREARVGRDHPLVARSLNHLGNVLAHRKDLTDARTAHEDALRIRESLLGPLHPDTAESLNNLANVLIDLGDLDGAHRLYRRAVHIRETVLGPHHPTTANSLINVAKVLRDQGQLDSARPLFERAVSIFEAEFGVDHPYTATSLNNLALVLHDQGDLPAARALHERALAIREAHLGADHPATAQSLSDLANVLAHEGDLPAARALHERALAIREAHLGADHPATAQSLSDLANVLAHEGDLPAARALHERALAIREAHLGADHPATAQNRRRLKAVLAMLQSQP